MNTDAQEARIAQEEDGAAWAAYLGRDRTPALKNTDPDNQCPYCPRSQGYEICQSTRTIVDCGHCLGSGRKKIILLKDKSHA